MYILLQTASLKRGCIYARLGKTIALHILYYLSLVSTLITSSNLAGNMTITRTVTSESTTLETRTNALTNLGILQTIGFALGPGMPFVFVN